MGRHEIHHTKLESQFLLKTMSRFSLLLRKCVVRSPSVTLLNFWGHSLVWFEGETSLFEWNFAEHKQNSGKEATKGWAIFGILSCMYVFDVSIGSYLFMFHYNCFQLILLANWTAKFLVFAASLSPYSLEITLLISILVKCSVKFWIIHEYDGKN